MKVDVSFPRCPSCTNDDYDNDKSYHKNCSSGGRIPLVINTDTSWIYCPSCDPRYERGWRITDSVYYCAHGHTFSAAEVMDEVNAIVANAKLIANELKRTYATQQRIRDLTQTSVTNTIEMVIKKHAGQTVWNLLRRSVGAIVSAVGKWLGISW